MDVRPSEFGVPRPGGHLESTGLLPEVVPPHSLRRSCPTEFPDGISVSQNFFARPGYLFHAT